MSMNLEEGLLPVELMNRVTITLENHPNYSLFVPLQGFLYKIDLYFNERMRSWSINLYEGNGDPIILGQRLSPNYPLFMDYLIDNLTGYFLLEPKGMYKNNTIINDYNIKKYYNLFYYYEEE